MACSLLKIRNFKSYSYISNYIPVIKSNNMKWAEYQLHAIFQTNRAIRAFLHSIATISSFTISQVYTIFSLLCVKPSLKWSVFSNHISSRVIHNSSDTRDFNRIISQANREWCWLPFFVWCSQKIAMIFVTCPSPKFWSVREADYYPI